MLARTTRAAPSSDGAMGGTGDIDTLQRQYRMMEVSRSRALDEKASSVRMQRAAMDKLKKDNERLKEELSLETRQARHANNQSAAAQIARLQDQGDLFQRKIELERRRIDELDKQIAKVERQILEQRRELGGVNASRENNASVQKQIRILENRLDKALVKFNEALAHNKQLREQIDNLRRERVVFDGIYRKLEEELAGKKGTMAGILAESDAAYRARDAAHAEMLALKAAADQQQANFEAEWAQLGQLIDKDRRLKEFIKTQQRERAMRGLADPAAEEEARLRKRVSKGAWDIAKDKAHIHLSMEKVQSYEEAFARIQKATRISDIDELVNTFVAAEDQNFSLFNYVNDLAHEIESMEEQIAELKADIAKFQASNPDSADALAGESESDRRARNEPQVGALGSRKDQTPQVVMEGDKPKLNADGVPIVDAGPIGPSDAQRKKMMLELESKLQRTEQQAASYDEAYQASLKTVGVLKSGIQALFYKLGCQNLAASEMLGSAGVTESNMMQYLGLIEERTNELIASLIGTRDENQGMSDAMRADGGGEREEAEEGEDEHEDDAAPRSYRDDQAAGAQVSIQPPAVDSMQDEEEEDEEAADDDRPLSERELRGERDDE